jgi:hypothetical protein
MSEASPSIFARLRAGLAGALTRMASGAHHLEAWSSRGTRPILLTLVAIAVLALGVLSVMHESRTVAAWMNGGHHGERIGPGPAPKPEGKPHGGLIGKPEGKPHAPAPPPPPPPPPPSTAQP